MTLKVAETPDGRVVRDILPTGECAWRKTAAGDYHYCADHKGPWVGVSWFDIPIAVRVALSREAAQ